MQKEEGGLHISVRTFLLTLGLLLGIMLVAGVLTHVIPQGAYERTVVDGNTVIVQGTYAVDEAGGGLPVWRWLTAPVEVLFTDKAVNAIMIMVFLLVIGGSFVVLEKSGILTYMMNRVILRYASRKYTLLALMVLVCMLLGSTIGMFEETVTLVPITVALALMLGWDSLVGIGLSVLSVGFGFAAGTFNPFTVGITQQLAGLPMFSGVALRAVWFCLVYGILVFFLLRYAKKVEANPAASLVHEGDAKLRERYTRELSTAKADDPPRARGLRILLIAFGLVLAYVITGIFITTLSDFSMPVMALCFLVGSLFAGRAAGYTGLAKTFFKGAASIAPSVMLILLAMSVTHIMETGGIIDTVLYYFYNTIGGLGAFGGVIALFFLVLVLQFFIGSAAAKAFLLMPIMVPLADMIGLTRQTAVQAFVLADGFTNMVFPTNVVLLITIGLVGIPYGKWLRWTWKLQAVLMGLSLVLLLLCVQIGYGPY